MVSPLTCLFWNVDGKIHLLDNVIGEGKLNPHIIMLAEGATHKKSIEDKQSEIKNYFNAKKYSNILMKADGKYRANVFAVHNDIMEAMVSSDPLQIEEIADFTNPRVLIVRLGKILFFVVHLPSKLKNDEKSQLSVSMEVSRLIRKIEKKYIESDITNDKFIVVVGDFNMNPFDAGMMMPIGFFAPYTFIENTDAEITINSYKYRYFYNPMWEFLGKANNLDYKGPKGTYFLKSMSLHTEFKANILDQILIRREFRHKFVANSLEIKDDLNLMNGSDHHPIYFKLDPEKQPSNN